MFRNLFSFYALNCNLLLVYCIVFSRTEIYRTFIVHHDFKGGEVSATMSTAGDKMLFHAPNYKMYAIDKKGGHINWEKYVGWKSEKPP